MAETLGNGRYEISRRLATGGMGEVLLAEFKGDAEISPGLLVVKRILSAGPSDPPAEGQVKMLREEGRLGLRLNHGNLVETFRMEESDPKNPLLVIELLAGRSMAQVLGQAKKRKENVPVDVALAILRGSCCGLHFAHTLKDRNGTSLGLVHRDVSPANIFVTFDGRVKVIDFGVAKSEDSEIKTATGILKGKLGYMSPEQSLGAAKLTAQADVWSLGVFFWEMLVAERLFASPNPTATLLQISQKEIPRPSLLRGDIPPAVEAICMRMLDRELPRRFQSCADVARAIDGLPGGGGISRVDVGGFLAGRFPEEADAGAKDAARCAKKVHKQPIPNGLVDGGTWNEMVADDDEPATAVLSAETRRALLAAAVAEEAVMTAAQAGRVDDDDDVATVRVTADIVEQARRAAADSAALKAAPGPARPRPPTQVGNVTDDEDLIMTAAVPPGSLASATGRPVGAPPSLGPNRPGPGEASATQRNPLPPAGMTLTDPDRMPLGPNVPGPGGASATLKNPVFGSTQPDPSALAPSPKPPTSSFPVPVAPGAPAPRAPSRTGMASGPSPAAPPAVPTLTPSRPRAPGNPPSTSSPVAQAAPSTNSQPQPAAPAPSPSSGKKKKATTSWLAVALSTFGALVLVMGVGFSFAIARPQPRALVVYTDPAGFDVVVGDAAQVPPGAPQRLVDPLNATLKKPGEEPKLVPGAELQAKLVESGVWARASLPAVTRTTLGALLPLLIAALGVLALAFAVPAFFVADGKNRALARVVAVVVVVAATAVVVDRGALSWPGRAAWRQTPRLEWK